MDLRSVLNTSDAGDRAPAKAPPTPQKQQQQRQPHPSQQSPIQYGYRDYGHPPPQHSPGKPMAQDYAHPHAQQQHQQPPPNSYPPHSPYQAPGPYPGRPAPPPLQPANSYHDARSPGGSMPAPSPYRPATTPSTASGGSGYPFPPSASPPEASSPVQRHQYPPAQQYQQHQRRDSYSQAAPAGHLAGPYMQQQQQQQHPVPQTPPVVTSGGSHPYLHQRSQSTHSTPTPTSAQSQHQYGPPYAHGSPIAASRPPPSEYNRPPSQPPTPVGPPLSAGSRHPSTQGNYAQPPSPYQQRMSSAAGAQVVQAQASPQPPPPPIKRVSSGYDSSAAETHRRSHSQAHSEREHSLSVSPKTRIPSVTSNHEQIPIAPTEFEPKASSPQVQNMALDTKRAATPAKRKLEDRDLSPRELERKESRPPPGEVNGGNHAIKQEHFDPVTGSPLMPRKKRLRRVQPPVWAQSIETLGKKLPKHANFVLQKRVHSHINGKQEGASRPDHASRHPSPEASRSQQSGAAHTQSPAEPSAQDLLGLWEASITGVKPYEEMSRTVADFLFIHVINSPDMQEIVSRGIQFEIEAKLGTLIDKDTNQRVERYLDSECILRDSNRLAFRSSMTEAQHKHFNDFLNQIVIQTDPRAPNGGSRVQVHYKHRREIDRFFELPLELQARLPGCMRARLGSRTKNVRVRVTYDQRSKEVLAKIIKARVADINLHFPTCPMDCRISINLEMNWDGPVEELEQHAMGNTDKHPDRNKDRLSYSQGHYQIDLTQVSHMVTGPGGSQRLEKEHELEIELAPEIVIDQGRKAMNNAPHRYGELIEGFVDNVRVLARKARELR